MRRCLCLWLVEDLEAVSSISTIIYQWSHHRHRVSSLQRLLIWVEPKSTFLSRLMVWLRRTALYYFLMSSGLWIPLPDTTSYIVHPSMILCFSGYDFIISWKRKGDYAIIKIPSYILLMLNKKVSDPKKVKIVWHMDEYIFHAKNIKLIYVTFLCWCYLLCHVLFC